MVGLQRKTVPSAILRIGWIALFLAGCCPCPRPTKLYLGPTEPMAQVVAEINANNAPLTTLWARIDFQAELIDDKGKSNFVSGDGALLFRKPRELRLVGNKDFAGNIFELGSTSDRFWLKVVPQVDTLWWGYYRNVGKPCARPMPIRPDLIVQVLGISDIDQDLLREPAPVMRFSLEQDAYLFVWSVRGLDRWIARKEIWYDRATKRPRRVVLFDDNGRVVLQAKLAKPLPVPTPDVSQDRWPTVAGEFQLFFPETGTKIELDLRNVALQKNGVPNERSIRFPADAGTSKVIQTDADCDR